MSEETNTENELERLTAARAKRKADQVANTNTQLVKDLEFVDALEEQYGPDNTAVVRVSYSAPDVPVACVVRAPKPHEIKRYRARVKGEDADTAAAAEEMGGSCLVYPDKAVFEKIHVARPGVKAQLGAAAVKLAIGIQESEGKG